LYIFSLSLVAGRRSRSLGDLLSESLQGEPETIAIKLKNLHERTPVAAPRHDKQRRYFSFDATNTNDDRVVDQNSKTDHHGSYDNMSSEIQSLKLSNLSGILFCLLVCFYYCLFVCVCINCSFVYFVLFTDAYDKTKLTQ